MAAEGKAIDALSQFELCPFLGAHRRAVGSPSPTRTCCWPFGLITALMLCGHAPPRRGAGPAPGRGRELYEFVDGIVVGQVGHEGRRYFPFVFAIFMFVLFGNMLGLLPYAFTYTCHIAVTLALALLVFVVTTVVALAIHGKHFFGYFFPEGAPLALAPLIIPVEVISYLSRPISLSVRLFANMVAGHVMLKVFATFVVLIGGPLAPSASSARPCRWR